MTPSDKDIIIIDGLIATGEFDTEEQQKLEAIKRKPGQRVSSKDAGEIAKMVKHKLRRTDD